MILRLPYLACNPLTSLAPLRFVSQGPGHGRSKHLHQGTDMRGQRGEAILAFGPGRVRGVYAHQGPGLHPEVSARGVDGLARRVFARHQALQAPNGFGLYVELVHPAVAQQDGKPIYLHTHYGHLEHADVAAGDVVEAGRFLGGMGDSGTNPVGGAVHLHFGGFLGPFDTSYANRRCMDSRGLLRYTTLAELDGVATSKPGPTAQRFHTIVLTPCFPASGTGLGQAGVDQPFPITGQPPYPRLANGTPILAQLTGDGQAAAPTAPTAPTAPAPPAGSAGIDPLALAALALLGAEVLL